MRYGTGANFSVTNQAQARAALGISGSSNAINAAINGRWDIWERGLSSSFNAPTVITSQIVADRWIAYVEPNGGTGASFTVTGQTFPIGQTEVPFNPVTFCRIANTTIGTNLGANSFVTLQHNIENVYSLQSETVTVSFYARSSITGKTLGIDFVQKFGTGGTPSPLVTAIGGRQFTLSTSWTRYTATVNIPSIAGKTLGTNGLHTSSLAFQFWLQAGTTEGSRVGGGFGWQGIGTIDLADVQIERGSIASPIEDRSIAEELILCQRYFQKHYLSARAQLNAGYLTDTYASFRVPMRISPTATLISAGQSANLSGAPLLNPLPTGTRFEIRANANGDTYALEYLYYFDAEL